MRLGASPKVPSSNSIGGAPRRSTLYVSRLLSKFVYFIPLIASLVNKYPSPPESVYCPTGILICIDLSDLITLICDAVVDCECSCAGVTSSPVTVPHEGVASY